MKGLRTTSPRAVIPPPAQKGPYAIPPRLAPRRSSLRAQKEKNSERVIGIKIQKEINMTYRGKETRTNRKGRRTTSLVEELAGQPAQPTGPHAEEIVEDLAGHPAQPTGPPAEDAEVVEEQLTGQRKDSAATEAKRWRKGY